MMFLRFQLPTSGVGRPAIRTMSGASRFRNVGLNKAHHAPSREGERKTLLVLLLVRKQLLHKLLVHQLQLLIAVQGGELLLPFSSTTFI